MHVALEVVEVIAGAFLVVTSVLSAIRATILPRGVQGRISGGAVRIVRAVFRLRASRLMTYESRDRSMAMLGPIALLAMLATWLVLIIAGFALMYFGITGRSWAASIELSGSSVFTLGTTTDYRLGPLALTYVEAALGLLIVALLITYLPSIYTAFSRREAGVSYMRVRAGMPPRAVNMLIRFQRIDFAEHRLAEFWRKWEDWFADIDETNTTFPILVFFRSPQPERSWITTAGAVLDGTAFWVGCVKHPNDPDAQLTLRAGYIALRRIADVFGIAYDTDPAVDDPISVTRQEWDAAMDELAAAGVPLHPDRDKCWLAWRGWRVNYDTVLLNLARLVEAPPAPWLSDRSPVYEVGPRFQRAAALRERVTSAARDRRGGGR